MSYTLLQQHTSGVRRGELSTAHGILQTPMFMPVATKASLKALTPRDLEQLETQIVLSNTYHLYLRPGHNVVREAGGLHSFMRWNKPILTDSGGYQVFSLGARLEQNTKGSSRVKFFEEGVEFQSHLDGSRHMITPEKSIEIQQALGSDIMMVFDECPPHSASKEYQLASMERTTRWARRCKEQHERGAELDLPNTEQQLFGIVQGGLHTDLRRHHAEQLQEIGFDGYALGGLAVGETNDEMYAVLSDIVSSLPADAPRYLMGVGKPENILEAVKYGIDMFDCVLPTRNARHGTVYVYNGVAADLSRVSYDTVHLTNTQFARDFSVLDEGCACEACSQGFTKAYIRHLFQTQEPLALRLATSHNVAFMMRLMRDIREIAAG